MTDEKRRFSRLPFGAKAKLRVGDAEYSVDTIANLSIGGCLLDIQGTFEPGDQGTCTILLPHMAPGIRVQAEIVRMGEGTVSLKFIGIEQGDLHHLQNIIRYNAEDPDAIEKEISAHPGLR